MGIKVYKSSTFKKVLYSFLTIVIIILSTWVMLYGLINRDKNMLMFIAGSLLCTYSIYILQKFYFYKVTLTQEYIEIYSVNTAISVKYDDILGLYHKKNACYIIEKSRAYRKYFDRDSAIFAAGSINSDDMEIDLRKAPVLQRTFIQGYDEIIGVLSEKCSTIGNMKNSSYDTSYFISTALLKSISESKASLSEIFKVLIPYMAVSLVFLMTLVVYGVSSKGYFPGYMSKLIKLVFPLCCVVAIYGLAFSHMEYAKKIIRGEDSKNKIHRHHSILYLIMNISISLSVIALFFIILFNTSF